MTSQISSGPSFFAWRFLDPIRLPHCGATGSPARTPSTGSSSLKGSDPAVNYGVTYKSRTKNRPKPLGFWRVRILRGLRVYMECPADGCNRGLRPCWWATRSFELRRRCAAQPTVRRTASTGHASTWNCHGASSDTDDTDPQNDSKIRLDKTMQTAWWWVKVQVTSDG